jgi:hypothetical protein
MIKVACGNHEINMPVETFPVINYYGVKIPAKKKKTQKKQPGLRQKSSVRKNWKRRRKGKKRKKDW